MTDVTQINELDHRYMCMYVSIFDFDYYEFCTNNLLKFVSVVDQKSLGNHIFSSLEASEHSSWLRLALFWDRDLDLTHTASTAAT